MFQQTDLQGSGRPLLRTPNRFTRTSQSAYWNTGNGSPDAVCFTVDKPGIVIAGLCVYGGGGQYDYDLELLDDVSWKFSFIWQGFVYELHLFSRTVGKVVS